MKSEQTECICPDCKQPACMEHGGGGRFWWRCETCMWESDIVPERLLLALGEMITMNCVGVHFYEDCEEQEGEEGEQ